MHPVLFQLGEFRLYSYCVLIALGGVLSTAFFSSKRARMGIKTDEDFWLLVNVILFAGFFGGRVLFLIEYVPLSHPAFWDSAFSFNKGFSVLGGFFGIVGGIWLFCRRKGLEFFRVQDYASQVAPFWHVFGRLGCFAAGCCFGRLTDMPWGVTFTDPHTMISPELLGRALHPAQLYEAAADLVLAAGLYFLILPKIESGRWPPGLLAAAHFAAYGVLRFFMEYFRADVVPLAAGLTAGQGLSLGLLVLAAATFWAALKAGRRPCTPT